MYTNCKLTCALHGATFAAPLLQPPQQGPQPPFNPYGQYGSSAASGDMPGQANPPQATGAHAASSMMPPPPPRLPMGAMGPPPPRLPGAASAVQDAGRCWRARIGARSCFPRSSSSSNKHACVSHLRFKPLQRASGIHLTWHRRACRPARSLLSVSPLQQPAQPRNMQRIPIAALF